MDISHDDDGAQDSLSENFFCEKQNAAAVKLANQLLEELNIPTRIDNISDISASFFVVLYQFLFSDQLPGIIHQPSSREDEVHNCQIVIDVLSTEVVHDSLSHIRGVDIVSGDVMAILNLLDIFSYLRVYVMKRIESDHDVHSISNTDPSFDSLAPISQRETEKEKTKGRNNNAISAGNAPAKVSSKALSSLNKNENRKAFDDHKVIRHEDYYEMTMGGIRKREDPPSPIRPDQSQSLLGQKTIDSDFETDSGKFATENCKPKYAWGDDVNQPGASLNRDGTTLKSSAAPPAPDAATATASLSGRDGLNTAFKSREADKAFSASLPAPKRSDDPLERRDEQLRSTVGPIEYKSRLTQEKTAEERRSPPHEKRLSSSYGDLRHLVEKTAALTRVALATSPIRGMAERDLDLVDISERPRPALSSERARLAKEAIARGLGVERRSEEIGKEKRVAFATSDLRRSHEDVSRVPLSDLMDNRAYYRNDSGVDLDSELLERVRGATRQYNAGIWDSEYDIVANKQKRPRKPVSAGKSRSVARQHALNGQAEIGAARVTLETEDRAIRRKQELLQKFYEKDREEFAEDVESLLERDQQKSKETEKDYRNRCAESAPKKKAVKKNKGQGGTAGATKKIRKSKLCGPKHTEKRAMSKATTEAPMRVDNEEDLLPLLLEQFPHLHLSEHTWHELWRRGLHQIEALTRAYSENKLKKSRAQSQVEEAAERHELLSNIMKKQLDHTKRLRDIKEQKRQQVQIRNKTHEKRMQSARARRYYNEYEVRARAKQLKRRTKEEMVFRELFQDALAIQKERIKDIRQYTTDQRKRQESRRKNEIDSLENFYQDQFEMLVERLAKEQKETEVREAAQQQMMERMKRELRKKMESEIQLYQQEMFCDNDDVHFRKMDAERMLQQLRLAGYSSKY